MFILKNFSNGTVIINKHNSYQQIEIPSGKHFNLGESLSEEEIKIYKNYHRIGLRLIHENTASYLKTSEARPEIKPAITPIAPFVPTTPVAEDVRTATPAPITEEIKPVEVMEDSIVSEEINASAEVNEQPINEIPVTEEAPKAEETSAPVEEAPKAEESFSKKNKKK